jgi:DNA-binding transcriptional regulator YiaG
MAIRRRLALLSSRPRAAGGLPLTAAEIRELRGGRSRKDFARSLGVTAATVYLWEAGRMRPSPPNRARLAALLSRARALGGRARRTLRARVKGAAR